MNNITSSSEIPMQFGLIGSAISFSLFVLNSHYLLPAVAPCDIQETKQKNWKWRNTVNSLIHSVITGVGSLIILWRNPEIRSDLINVSTTGSIAITSITVGYFIYDFIDLFINNYKKHTLALLLHHGLVTICFGLALLTQLYQGYAMVALLVELNSIFLHIRQLFIIHGVSKNDTSYRINSIINILTFLVCRLLPLSWQTRWLALNQSQVARPVVILGFVTNTVILILNMVLLAQVTYKDYVKKAKKT